jgi:hypothetical protein
MGNNKKKLKVFTILLKGKIKIMKLEKSQAIESLEVLQAGEGFNNHQG